MSHGEIRGNAYDLGKVASDEECKDFLCGEEYFKVTDIEAFTVNTDLTKKQEINP